MKTGFILFAHGSSLGGANDAVRAVTAETARRGGFELSETAFLDVTPPGLTEAVRRLVACGAGRIVVVPYFLTPGLHLQRDLPRLIEEARQANGNPRIEVTPPLDGHPALVQIALDRLKAAFE